MSFINNNKYLIIIDMQNDFIDGSLGSEYAKAIVPKILNKIKEFKGNIIVTKDTHKEDYLLTQEGKNLPIRHCIQFTNGWNLNSDIESAIGSSVITYRKYSFGSLSLANDMSCYNFIDKTNPREFHIVGVCTDICVIANALMLKSACPEARIIVHKDLCAGTTIENHEYALKVMQSCQIEVI